MIKRHLGLFHRRLVPLDSVPDLVGSAQFLQTARDISQRSIVLVADSTGTVDSLRARPRPVVLVTYGEENAGTVGNTLARRMREAGYKVTLFRLWPASGLASLDSARTLIRKNGYTIFAASVKVTASKGTVGLPEPIAKLIEETNRRRHTVLISFGSPYIGMQVPHLRSYMLGWTASGLGEWAVARALTGQAPITGRLPVLVPPSFPLGSGLERGTALGGSGAAGGHR
jgi:hypothetical protein